VNLSVIRDHSSQYMTCRHDNNEVLEDSDSFMKTKDWKDIKPVWQEYVQEQFSECLNCEYEMKCVDPGDDRCQGTGWRMTSQGRLQKNEETSI
jgi:hypothetical protein